MRYAWHHSGAPEAYKMALRILEKRQRSTEEMRSLLLERRCSAEAIDEVLERLQDLGYINDHDLAHIFIRRAQAKGWGPRRIRMELKKRGLGHFGESLADETGDDYPRILELVSHHRDRGRSDPQITGVLMRLGHRRALIMRALKEAPKSALEMEMLIPPGLLDLDLDEEDFGLEEED